MATHHQQEGDSYWAHEGPHSSGCVQAARGVNHMAPPTSSGMGASQRHTKGHTAPALFRWPADRGHMQRFSQSLQANTLLPGYVP